MRSLKIKRWLLLATCMLLFSSASNAGRAQEQLNAQEQKVIDYLVHDWGQDFQHHQRRYRDGRAQSRAVR